MNINININQKRFQRKSKVSLGAIDRYLKRFLVPTRCWQEIKSKAGLVGVAYQQSLTEQEYDRVMEVRTVGLLPF